MPMGMLGKRVNVDGYSMLERMCTRIEACSVIVEAHESYYHPYESPSLNMAWLSSSQPDTWPENRFGFRVSGIYFPRLYHI